MHLLTLRDPIVISPDETISPGSYVVEDVAGAHLLVLAGGGGLEPYQGVTPPLGTFPDARILLCRMGGFGDLLLLTPVLRAIRAKFPLAYIAVCTIKHYAPAIANLDYINEVIPWPPKQEVVESFSSVVYYENAIEKNPRAHEVHMTDLFAELAGIELPDDPKEKKPDYAVKATEAIWLNEAHPRNGMKRLCMQAKTSARARNYPQSMVGEVALGLVRKGWEVFLLGGPGEVDLKGRALTNLHNMTERNLTFRQSCALIHSADAFVGADSALLHVAGALGVPAVGLYGAFPWKLRTAYCPTTFAIQGTGACEPCFHHVNSARQNHFPAHCPSKAKGVCELMAAIPADRVIAKVEQVARQWGPGGRGEAAGVATM
jgi:ADP-heptose:LPS heptosyltransferase